MKFVKSNLAKKLIIILIALMIFNIALPKNSYAWDFGGILFKPISTLCLSSLVSIDITLGFLLNGLSTNVSGIAAVITALTSIRSRRCGY